MLESDEALELDGVDGAIHSIRIGASGLELRFGGSVNGLRAVRGGQSRSLMPTWHEWARSRHTAALLWGAIGYAVATALAWLHWWRST